MESDESVKKWILHERKNCYIGYVVFIQIKIELFKKKIIFELCYFIKMCIYSPLIKFSLVRLYLSTQKKLFS